MARFWKKLSKTLFSQRTTIILLLLMQILFLAFTLLSIIEYTPKMYYLFQVLGVLLAIAILTKAENPAYKLAWIIPLLAIPIFATVAYFVLSNQYGTRRVRTAHLKKCEETKPLLAPDKKVMQALEEENRGAGRLARYLDEHGGYPACGDTAVEYFPSGEAKFPVLLQELRKAERFIFMEYFIIAEGEMWSQVEEILLEKAAQGVDVRLIYDGMASQSLLPYRYDRTLREKGIRCHVYNPFRPMLSSIQNNRDHRKICVIDGNVAFNGGINLADEYINRLKRFGYWKDSAVMLRGAGVWNFTMMFLQMWEILDPAPDDYELYRPTELPEAAKGFVIPYGDSPLDEENVGEFVYLDMIYGARDYVYITTPYLIPNNELVTALEFAAKSGVKVRLITPGIPDKWYCRSIAWDYYYDLIRLGVEIYEFTDGFIHAKNFVSDDKSAVVGTINLDYRSLYLHFECATYMYKTPCVADVKKDFERTLRRCHKVTIEDCRKRSVFNRMASAVLRVFAPLL